MVDISEGINKQEIANQLQKQIGIFVANLKSDLLSYFNYQTILIIN